MAHRVYNTTGLVIERTAIKEASEFVTVLTRDLGLVRMIVQGVRKQEAKLRYGTLPFGYSDLSLVRGKTGWRLINAAPQENFFFSFNNKRKRRAFSNVINVVRRLVTGEKVEPALLAICLSFAHWLTETPAEEASAIKHAEEVTVLRLLYELGYVADEGELEPFYTDTALTDTLLKQYQENRPAVVKAINRAFQTMHL